MPEDYVIVAKCAKPWGLHGWLKIQCFLENPQLLTEVACCYLGAPVNQPELPLLPIAISAYKIHGNAVLIQLPDYPDIASLAPLCSRYLLLAQKDFPPLPAGEEYLFRLIGMEVLDETGQSHGQVIEISTQPSCDLLVVAPLLAAPSSAKQAAPLLIPCIWQRYLQRVDHQQQQLHVHLAELLEAVEANDTPSGTTKSHE